VWAPGPVWTFWRRGYPLFPASIRTLDLPVRSLLAIQPTPSRCIWTTKSLLLLHRALWNLYIVHLPTNALFIKLGNV